MGGGDESRVQSLPLLILCVVIQLDVGTELVHSGGAWHFETQMNGEDTSRCENHAAHDQQ
jgi:hypothetical protein